MIYPVVIRPLLFQLDAERAHDFTLKSLSRFAKSHTLTRTLHAITGHESPVNLMGLRFPNRVGLAGGLDKNGVAVAAWWALGFGFVELGTVTPRPQQGNPQPRMFRFPQQRSILNRMGFNNHGAEAVAARLATLTNRPAFPIGISVGKQGTTPVDDVPAVIADYVEAAVKLAPQADFISINVSSPNTSGLRSLQTSDTLTALVTTVKNAIGAKPLLVKVAPELSGNDLHTVVDAVMYSGAAGLIATNTLQQFDEAGKSIGGLSGKPLKELAPQRVEAIRKFAPSAAVIGCGGIDDVASARRMIDAGADLVQVYTGLVYEGPGLIGRLSRGLSRTATTAS
ncbi:quinone-dependent dihydroorotate dehydrogenase [soil metagenome]